jgi:hypothetical protein
MIPKFKNRNWVRLVVLFGAVLLTDSKISPLPTFVSDAQAVIGRPLTPLSYAGVARRTVRRSTIYVNTLPHGCTRVAVNGVYYSHCGGTYYQPYNGRYVVVYIN